MMSLSEPKQVLDKLSANKLFQDWKVNNSNTFLSHFFCPLDKEFNPKSNWELGFYNLDSKKITVFVTNKDETDFAIKPEDDVFKKESSKVEELKLDKVKVHLDTVKDNFLKNFPEFFPKEVMGDGFIILQTIKDKTLWNITMITRTLKLANIKFNVDNGEVSSHETVNLMVQNKGHNHQH